MTVNLLGLDPQALEAFAVGLGEPRFRAVQLLRWIYQSGESDFGAMSDLAKSAREKLARHAEIVPPEVIGETTAQDGTRKWLLDVGERNAVEMVFIPQPDRGTLCISTQAGCTLACDFCSTGRQGFNRNLTTAEIVGQVWLAGRSVDPPPARERGLPRRRAISNVVLMGMGEPLLNLEAVVPALRLMLSDRGFGLSRRRVTVSTSGIVPMMDALREQCPVALAVSLHAPTDELRDRLIPINRKYPLAELMAACRRYLERAPRDFVTFEYVMLAGINDQPEHARRLAALVADVPCKINLIPFNPFPGTVFSRSSDAVIEAFSAMLSAAGILTTIRRTRGGDIDAACGLLAGRVEDRTRRTLKLERAIG